MEFERPVQNLFLAKKWTLSCAESCTGGTLSSRLVALPDASLYFLGSIVAYCNRAKVDLLGVDSQTLEVFGAVSEKTASQMAEGALKAFRSDVALAVSGIAGPRGGSENKPLGMVSFAIVSKFKKSFAKTLHLKGNRAKIIASSCEEILKQLIQYCE